MNPVIIQVLRIIAKSNVAKYTEAGFPFETGSVARVILHSYDEALSPEPIIDLQELSIQPRTLNALRRNYFTTVGEVMCFSAGELMTLQGIGEAAIMDLNQALQKKGLNELK